MPDHVLLLNRELERVERGDGDRLAIHMPPRHAKSETVTIRGAFRAICQWPGRNVCVICYNETLALKFSRRVRNLAMQVGLVDRSKSAAGEWETIYGGLFMARGIKSPPTGTGFWRIFIDDPIKTREEADSEVVRAKIDDAYRDDIYTRLEPGAALILTMTRWHHEDLGQTAVESEPERWRRLVLRAISEEDDPLGRAPGQALWPERFDVAALERIRAVQTREHGLRSWEALYQQRPTPREGAYFKVDRLSFVDEVPRGLRRVRAWDWASSGQDYSVGVLMAGPDRNGFYYVVDVVRGRWDTFERMSIVEQTAELDGQEVEIIVPEDPGSAGKDVARIAVARLAGYRVHRVRPDRNKVVRADAHSVQINASNVRLRRGRWNSDFVEEYRQFPQGKYDDQVDAGSDAFNHLALAARRQVAGFKSVKREARAGDPYGR